MRKFFFWSSILLNVTLLALLWAFIVRLGGWHYVRHRFEQDESGLYLHRKQLFERMPVQRGAWVFLGDSQVEQCEWSEFLDLDSIKVLNRGISGDHTHGLLGRLEEVLRHKPSAIFLEVGINDLLLRVPTAEAIGRYREIVAKIRQHSPETTLRLCSVLPVNNDVKYVGVENPNIQALNVQIAALARQYALPYLDFYPQLLDPQGRLSAKFTDDGVHLNAEGYAVIKKLVIASARDDQ
jgi:lysophospholipase L1-like esterase